MSSDKSKFKSEKYKSLLKRLGRLNKKTLVNTVAQLIVDLPDDDIELAMNDFKADSEKRKFNYMCNQHVKLFNDIDSVSDKRKRSAKYQKKIERLLTLEKQIVNHPLYETEIESKKS